MCKLSAKGLATGLFLAFLGVHPPSFASDVGPWTQGANSQARLLAAGPPLAGIYLVGLEIDLKAGAHTYWRNPGDAGVPPSLSTAGSRNVKSAHLRFPAPERLQEGALSVNGYRNSLILPLEIVPQDVTAPVHLAIHFSYAACEKICIPAELSGTLDLSPQAPPSTQAPRLAQALSRLPQQASAESLGLNVTPPQSPERLVWQVALKTGTRDVFAEGPEGWFFETKAKGDQFELTAAEAPKNWSGPVPVRLTLTGPRDVEITLDLPRP